MRIVKAGVDKIVYAVTSTCEACNSDIEIDLGDFVVWLRKVSEVPVDQINPFVTWKCPRCGSPDITELGDLPPEWFLLAEREFTQEVYQIFHKKWQEYCYDDMYKGAADRFSIKLDRDKRTGEIEEALKVWIELQRVMGNDPGHIPGDLQ